MKVSTLIRQLKKMPPNAEVVFQNHDNGPTEWDGVIRKAMMAEDEMNERAKSDEYGYARGIVVLIL